MNWSEYNKNLKKRGEIFFWVPDNIEEIWFEKEKEERKVGHPITYSDTAIAVCIKLRSILKMPLRATEGFVHSLFQALGYNLSVPCFSQLSRRMGGLKPYRVEVSRGENIHIAIDSTGLKVYGEGEWKVRQHGSSKRRVWRKIHLASDVASFQIVAHKLTNNNVSDGSILNEIAPSLTDRVARVLADGAYDQTKCYESVRRMGAKFIVPPRVNARMQKGSINPAKVPRDHAIAYIRRNGNDAAARKKWKKESGYHQRSLAETAVYRLKKTFGDTLQSRSFKNQKAELDVKIAILNKIASLGMPKNL